MTSRHEATGYAAFLLSQQVVVPLAVSVSAQVRRLSALPHYTDVSALSSLRVDRIEGFPLALDAFDCRLPADTPSACVTDMRDVLVPAFAVGLVDTVHMKFVHGGGLGTAARVPLETLRA